MFEYQPVTDAVANGDMPLTEDVAQAIAGEYLGQLAMAGARKLWGWLAPESKLYDAGDIRNTDTPTAQDIIA
jgi:hypothetical protein